MRYRQLRFCYQLRPFLRGHLADACLRGLKKNPGAVVVIDGYDGSQHERGRLLAGALALSRIVLERVPEKRVGIVLPSGAPAVLANLAVLFAGKIPVNLNFTAGQAALGGAGGSGLTAYPQDPFQWRALKGVRIHTEIGMAAQRNKDWIHMANASDPRFYMDFDPAKVMEDALKIQGEDLQTIAPVDQEETSRTFEKGFWAKWLEQYGYTVATTSASYFYNPVTGKARINKTRQVVENAGKKVKDRCEAIGLDITPYMETARANALASKAEQEAADDRE